MLSRQKKTGDEQLNYSYLSIWCAQNRELQFQIEAVYRSAQELSLCCKDGRELRFVLRSREAFPLLLPAYRKQGESIWNQLRHASLSKLSIDEGDRIIYLDLSLTDIYQQAKVFRLIAELSPPRPNLILCELADSRATWWTPCTSTVWQIILPDRYCLVWSISQLTQAGNLTRQSPLPHLSSSCRNLKSCCNLSK